jgi:predicted nucleic acid-binding protein
MIYADSSFYVSLHVVDRHSHEAWRRMSLHPSLWLTTLNRAEFAHAVFAHVFWKKATMAEAHNAISDLDRDIARGIVRPIELPEQTFDRSVVLARLYNPALGMSTLDSLHVACALELKADKFWTFDERQAKLAEAAGLDTTA